MNSVEYDLLLARIRSRRELLSQSVAWMKKDQEDLERLLSVLDQEESRIAREALTSIHSASRKLVVGE